MAKKLSKAKAREMLHNPPHGKPLTDRQRRYFGAVANSQKGGEIAMFNPDTGGEEEEKNTTPEEKKEQKKRARIIANSQFPEFKEEYERTKKQYEKFYPGGIEFVEARGYNELKKAFGQVAPEEDIIMMAHYNPDAMYGVPVSDPTYQTLDAPKGATLASLFKGLQEKGYTGNCYMGICQGEDVAQSLQGAGVDIPIFGTPSGKKWFGSNLASKGDFEDFFFGVKGEKKGEVYETSTIDPEIGKDYKLLLSERQQELMNRRKSGTPVKEVTPLKMKKGGKVDPKKQIPVVSDATRVSDPRMDMLSDPEYSLLKLANEAIAYDLGAGLREQLKKEVNKKAGYNLIKRVDENSPWITQHEINPNRKKPEDYMQYLKHLNYYPPVELQYPDLYKNGGEVGKSGIYIKPSKRGTFTAAAKKHGKGVQEFAAQVMANKENYSPAMVKKANFARNAASWHEDGGLIPYEQGGGLKRSEDYGSKKKPYPSVKSSDFAGGGRSYPIPTKADAIDALRLAGLHGRSDVKSKVYKKYPDLKKANLGEVVEGLDTKLEDIGGIGGATTGIIQGLQLLNQERQNKKQTEQLLALSNIVNQAAGIAPDMPRRKYVRPEDVIINPNEIVPSYGTGTNFLAKNGGEYKPKMKYQEGGFLFPEAGSMLGSFLGGGKGQQSGAGKIGSTVGGIAGSFLGPVGGLAGNAIGGLIGGFIGGNEQKRQQQQQEQAYNQLQNAAFQQGTRTLQNQYSAFMKNGGELPSYNLGGDLKVYDGNAEVISQNPYLPDGGETVMFNGPSHTEGGMFIKYGGTPVEVEGGEPAVKLEHGGAAGQDNLVVYGDMKIPSYGASELNDPKAKGKKFKSYIKELSKIEDKQNTIVEKGIDIVNTTPVVDSFDKLKFSSGKAMVEGGNMKLKEIAEKKKTAASIQSAILDTADEFGLKSNELAEGNIKKVRWGKKIKAQDGIEKGGPFAHQTDYEQIPREDAFADSVAPESAKFDWRTVLNSVLPNLRPSNQLPLDPAQLSGEMLALATNQLEPVQAQTYQPLLEQTSDISLQDQLNLNQADFNALLRQTAGNPAVQAVLAAQKYAANTGVLGEQFRLNQAQRMGVQARNRAALNDATLRNLAILDQQYVRQSQAKSATKATAQAALSSIADKIARNKLENRTLGIYENLYNYRFGPKGQAINLNPLAQFNIQDVGKPLPIYDAEGNITGYRETESVREDRYGMTTGKTKTKTTTTKTTKRNGGLVKALKGY